jgi:hypothetical protein
MHRYQIWNKTDNIYTLAPDENGKGVFTPEEWIAKYPWAAIPGMKCIIGGGQINGTVMIQFDQYVDMYRNVLDFTDMTDDEILAAIEDYEMNPPPPPEMPPSPEERMAAALEYQMLMGGDE